MAAFFSGCGLQLSWGRKKGRRKRRKLAGHAQTPEISGDIIEVLLQCTGGTLGIITPTEAPSQVVTIRM